MVRPQYVEDLLEELNDELGLAAATTLLLTKTARKYQLTLGDGSPQIEKFNQLADNFAKLREYFDEMESQLVWGYNDEASLGN